LSFGIVTIVEVSPHEAQVGDIAVKLMHSLVEMTVWSFDGSLILQMNNISLYYHLRLYFKIQYMKEINQAYLFDNIVSYWCFGQEFKDKNLTSLW
jgi:hypothetical protein